jgi:hypothetical protein
MWWAPTAKGNSARGVCQHLHGRLSRIVSGYKAPNLHGRISALASSHRKQNIIHNITEHNITALNRAFEK